MPYACKPQHRSFREWINHVKPASVLVLGDEILRDLFCQQYYPDVDTDGEEPKDEQCTCAFLLVIRLCDILTHSSQIPLRDPT